MGSSGGVACSKAEHTHEGILHHWGDRAGWLGVHRHRPRRRRKRKHGHEQVEGHGNHLSLNRRSEVRDAGVCAKGTSGAKISHRDPGYPRSVMRRVQAFTTALALASFALSAAYTCQPAAGRPCRASARAPTRAVAPLLTAEQDVQGERRIFPFLQAKVPLSQQPLTELRELEARAFFDWAQTDAYNGKIQKLFNSIMLFASLPIAYTTYSELPAEIPQLVLSASIGTFAVLIPFIIRLRVGWGYVSQRLTERRTYYEASQRGLFANKDRETRLRDRLIQQQAVRTECPPRPRLARGRRRADP